MPLDTRLTDAAQTAVARLGDELRDRLAALTDDLTHAAADAETSHARELDGVRAELAGLRRELEQARAALGQHERERAELRDAHGSARQLAEEEHAAALATVNQLLAQRDAEASALRDADTTALAAARQEIDAALAEAEQALAQAVRLAAAQGAQSEAAALLESAQLARRDATERLVAMARTVAAMDESSTLSDVLDALSDGIAAQAPRGALLVFQDARARVWRRHGFAADDLTSGAELDLTTHGDLKAIVDAATPALVGGADGPVLGFATLAPDARGLAVPVAIGGQAAALVYADGGTDAGSQPEAGWTDTVEILARHAARCLETLTAMRAAGYARSQRPAVVVPMPPHLTVVQRPSLETPVGDALDQARRVARLLVSEIRLNREADVQQGRVHGDLGDRLDTDIARARGLYLSRVSEGVPGRDALFDEEVVRTLANGDPALLRRPTGS